MSRIDPCFFGKGKEMVADTFAKLIEIASLQVGTSDASIEQHIAGEETSCFLAIIHDASRRMSRHMEGFQLNVTKGDGIALAHIASQCRLLFLVQETEASGHGRCLVQQEFILLTAFRTQSVFLEEERISEDMVKVQMGVEHMLQLEIVFAEVVLQALLLFGVETSRINHYRLARLVGQNVTVHGEHIEFEFLYFHSIIFFTTDYTDFHGLERLPSGWNILKICVYLCNLW